MSISKVTEPSNEPSRQPVCGPPDPCRSHRIRAWHRCHSIPCDRPRDGAVRRSPAHIRRTGSVCSDEHSVLHSCRLRYERSPADLAACSVRRISRWPLEGRSCAGDRRHQHVLRRHQRRRRRRSCGHRLHFDPGNDKGRLQTGFRHGSNRLCFHCGPTDPAKHPHACLWGIVWRINRRPVSGGRGARNCGWRWHACAQPVPCPQFSAAGREFGERPAGGRRHKQRRCILEKPAQCASGAGHACHHFERGRGGASLRPRNHRLQPWSTPLRSDCCYARSAWLLSDGFSSRRR